MLQFTRVVLICCNERIAEEISSLFRKKDFYFPVFEAPSEFISDDFGYVANACIRISNAIEAIRPTTVVIAGCSPSIVARFRDSLSRYSLVEIDNYREDLLVDLEGVVPKEKRKEIPLVQKEQKNKLNGDIVVVEANSTLSITIAKNIAMATRSKLYVLEAIDEREKSELENTLAQWNSHADALVRDSSRQELIHKLSNKVGFLIDVGVTSVSFICTGLPYGLLPFQCPTTHYFDLPYQLGLSMVRGVLKTNVELLRVPVAVLCDPCTTGESEFFAVRDILAKENGYVLRNAYKKLAHPFDVGLLAEYFPSDILLFSAHAGEQSGERVKVKFKTPDNKTHEIVYDRVLNFVGTDEHEMIQVQEFMRFVSMDDVPWPIADDVPLRDELVAAHKFYITSKDDEWEVSKIKDVGPLKASDSLGMSQGAYFPTLHNCGGHVYPLVVGNACSTWRECSIRFSFAGASVFIGTALDISNAIAMEVVPSFFRRMCKGQGLAYALFHSQKSFIDDLGYTPYLMHGYLHTKLPPLQPFSKNGSIVLRSLLKSKARWGSEIQSLPKTEEGYEKVQRVIRFLDREISHFKKAGIQLFYNHKD